MLLRSRLLPALGVAVGALILTAPRVRSAGGDFLQANINPAVDPADDFFEHANGSWFKHHPIPPTEPAWGIGSEVIQQLNTSKRKISEEAARGRHPVGSDQQRIGDFWNAGLDAALADRLGARPLEAELAQIDAAKDLDGIVKLCFDLQALEVSLPVYVWVGQDRKDSATTAVYVFQSGLGLPDRDSYLSPESGSRKVREAYVAHVARVLRLLGRRPDEADRDAARVMDFETELAKNSRSLEDRRDPLRNYNPMAPGDLEARLTPSIAWSDRLRAWGLSPTRVIVGQPEYLRALDALLTKTEVATLRDYLRVHLVDAYAEFLSRDFDEEHFAFYGRVLGGLQSQSERWKRVLDAEESALGMTLGRLFVKEFFTEAAKIRYTRMIENIRDALRARIDRLEWMSPATKEQAQRKLAAMKARVGYPEKWKDDSGLRIGRESYAQNMMSAARWRFADMIASYGRPVDRSEWKMTPQTYDAYYSVSNNEIVVPAGVLLVPGVPDSSLDDALAYGYAGALIGHEITHGFDDRGRRYDAAGNLTDWWTAEDDARFRKRAETLTRQFSAYVPLPGLPVNGSATLSENIADLGGALLALDAFKKTEEYRRGEEVFGMSPLKRYFYAFAFGYAAQRTEANLRNLIQSDPHAPDKLRVNGPLANVPEFYEAFDVRPGKGMWRPKEERASIW